MVGAAFLLLAAGLAALVVRNRNSREHALADGSVMRLAKVNFGKEQPYEITDLRGDVEAWLKKWLPKAWSRKWFKPPPGTRMSGRTTWYMNTVTHKNNDALWIYFTRRTPGTTNYQNVDIQQAELLDSHGCSFLVTQMGGSDDGRMPPRTGFTSGPQCSVEWLRFEAFPRHEKKFQLRLYDKESKLLTAFDVANPAFRLVRTTNWVVETLPIAKTNNRATFILSDIEIKSNMLASTLGRPRFQSPAVIQPTFKFLENGKPSEEWQALDMELYDSSGNFASKMNPESLFLCPYEPAWKLHVRFYGSDASVSASNIVWTIPKIKVPASGEFVALDVRRTVLYDQVDVLALAGPGKVTYSNEVPIKATTEMPERDGLYPVSNERTVGYNFTSKTPFLHYESVAFRTPHIAMYITGLTNDERLTIRATDETGRSVYAESWRRRFGQSKPPKRGEINYLENQRMYGMEKSSYYQLDLPADAKTVDLTLCVHYPTVEDFIFKPPDK